VRLPSRYSGPVLIDSPTGHLGAFRGAIVPTTRRTPRIGELQHQATHEAFLPISCGLVPGQVFWLTWRSRVYVPADDIRSLEPMAPLFQFHVVDRDLFYFQFAEVNGSTIQLRIEALNGPAEQAGSGAMDVAVVNLASHRGHLPPNLHLNQGDDITTTQGEKFRVMDPIQRDPLGDTVGLSREGTGVW
jgi:hypothetical protein